MAQAFKWDYATHKYTPHRIPEDWKCPLTCASMDTPVNCASCGAEMTFGDGYTSRVIHNAVGFGYYVCKVGIPLGFQVCPNGQTADGSSLRAEAPRRVDCMKKEWAAERAAGKEQQE